MCFSGLSHFPHIPPPFSFVLLWFDFFFLAYFLKMERNKECVGLGEWGCGKDLRGEKEGGTVIRIYYEEN